MNNTIVAISSGKINQAISIVRMSGEDSLKIINKIINKDLKIQNKMYFRRIYNNKIVIDEVMVVFYKAPNTFTGENMVEIFCHGGVVNTNKIIQLILRNGAIQAKKGDFSLRSFINGKMSLAKAQNINELINAKTDFQARVSAKNSFESSTNKLINALKQEILNIIAICEINIDYPEYDDVEVLTNKQLIPEIKKLINKYNKINNNSKKINLYYRGIKISIVGEPNTGKSSLLNALIKDDKAIVTSTAGTTRDLVEGNIIIDNVLFNFIDTAGIRKTSNEIELLGIQKTLTSMKNSDLIINLIDPTKKVSLNLNKKIKSNTKNRIVINVINKKDLLTKKQLINKNNIYISAKNNDIDELINKLKAIYPKINPSLELSLSTAREISLLEMSKDLLSEALSGLEQGLFPDTIIIDLNNAWKKLSEINGNFHQDDLLTEIFSNFCLGK